MNLVRHDFSTAFETGLTAEIAQRNIKTCKSRSIEQREQRAVQYERVCDSTNSGTKMEINYLPMPESFEAVSLKLY